MRADAARLPAVRLLAIAVYFPFGCAVAIDLARRGPVAVHLAQRAAVSVPFDEAVAFTLLPVTGASAVDEGSVVVAAWLAGPAAAVAAGLLRAVAVAPGIGCAVAVAARVLRTVPLGAGARRTAALAMPVRACGIATVAIPVPRLG